MKLSEADIWLLLLLCRHGCAVTQGEQIRGDHPFTGCHTAQDRITIVLQRPELHRALQGESAARGQLSQLVQRGLSGVLLQILEAAEGEHEALACRLGDSREGTEGRSAAASWTLVRSRRPVRKAPVGLANSAFSSRAWSPAFTAGSTELTTPRASTFED
jgi:hypothetical protein